MQDISNETINNFVGDLLNNISDKHTAEDILGTIIGLSNNLNLLLDNNQLNKIFLWCQCVQLNKYRIKLLSQIIEDYKHNKSLVSEIKKMPFDFSFEIFIISKGLIRKYLYDFINEMITAQDLYDWADFIEQRDDIGYDVVDADLLKEIVFFLANPEINYPLTKRNIEEIFLIKLA